MADVFISYAREDAEFVRRLNDALKARGKETWVDWESILPSAEWLKEIYAAIEAADTVLFVISPDSVASEVCGQEIAHAVAHNKRLVPIVYREVPAEQVNEVVAAHNWIFFRENDSFEQGIEFLIRAIDTDLEWVHEHTALLTRALEWERYQRDKSLGLDGAELARAETRLAMGEIKEPRLTPLQIEYILASRRYTSRRQRIVLGASTFAVFTAVILTLLIGQRRRTARLYLSRDFQAKAVWARADNDVLAAEVLLARSLTLDSSPESRERFLEARVRRARLAWISPRQDGSVYAISPNGRQFVVKENDRTIRLWDLDRHAETLRLPDDGPETLCLAFSADGRKLAAGQKDGSIRVWTPGTGRTAQTLAGSRQAALCLAFSPDGRRIAAGGPDGVVRLWDIPSHKLLHVMAGHNEQVSCLAFSRDGGCLASGSWDHHLVLWDAATGRLRHRLAGH
jgi:hypothetical protein